MWSETKSRWALDLGTRLCFLGQREHFKVCSTMFDQKTQNGSNVIRFLCALTSLGGVQRDVSV